MPLYSFLKSVLHSNEKVVTMIKRIGWCSQNDYKKTLYPNVALLKEVGVTASKIKMFLFNYSHVLFAEHVQFHGLVNQVMKLRFEASTTLFLEAIYTQWEVNKPIRERGLKVYKEWGWFDADILYACKKRPLCLLLSEKKLTRTLDFLMSKMGFRAGEIAKTPYIFSHSFEGVIIRRGSVLKVLVLKGLIKEKCTLSFVFLTPEKYFLKRSVARYHESITELLSIYRDVMLRGSENHTMPICKVLKGILQFNEKNQCLNVILLNEIGGKEQGFLEVFSTDATSRQSTLTESRRLAIHLRVDHTLPTQDLHVRSLLVNHDSSSDFAQKTMMVKELAAAFKKCKFLRVLQLCNIQLANDEKALPEEIRQLIFLRYLEIRNSSIYEIPQSISNLCRLLTFDYGVDRDDAQIRIPSDVFNKMERLVYLRFPCRNPIRVLTTSASGATSKIELNGLKSLQTLWGISSKSFRGLEHLSCLKELKIVHVASMEEMDAVWQCPSIKMDRLCKLNLQWEDNVEAQSLEPISHYRHLTLLTLRGRLCMLSNLPYNLSELRLYQSRLRQDSIPALGNLHHLRWLTMCYGAYADAKMIIRGDAFPQLVTLLLGDLIEEILLGSPAMPQIQWLFHHPSQWITYEPNSSFPEMKVVLLYLPEMEAVRFLR
ncbi:hypothetical protein Ancab_001173 [Ancistrocladus abbreviatus]